MINICRIPQALQLELVHEHFGGGGGPIDALHPLSSLRDDSVKEYLHVIMQKYGDVGSAYFPAGLPDVDTASSAYGAVSTPASTPGTKVCTASVCACTVWCLPVCQQIALSA